MIERNYLDIKQAAEVLTKLGIDFNMRQMKRAATLDVHGNRKLPFFIDPVDKKLKIEETTLLNIYLSNQKAAENCAIFRPLD